MKRDEKLRVVILRADRTQQVALCDYKCPERGIMAAGMWACHRFVIEIIIAYRPWQMNDLSDGRETAPGSSNKDRGAALVLINRVTMVIVTYSTPDVQFV